MATLKAILSKAVGRIETALMLFILTASIVIMAIELYNIHVVQMMIDGVFVNRTTTPMKIAVIFCITGISSLAISTGRRYVNAVLTERVLRNLRIGILDKCLRLRLDYFDENGTSGVISRLTSDVPVLQRFFTTTFLNVVANSVIVIVAFVIVMRIDVVLGLLAVVLQPLSLLFTHMFKKTNARASSLSQAGQQEMLERATDTVSGLKDIVLYGADKLYRKRFVESSLKYYRTVIASEGYRCLSGVTSPTIIAFLNIVGLFVGSTKVLSGQITLGTLVAYMSYRGWVGGPIEALAHSMVDFQSATGVASRIASFLEIPERDDLGKGIPPVSSPEIVFDHVGFSYECHDGDILRDISFKLEAGDKVALVGRSGAGKSTMVRLLLGIQQCRTGRVLFCGEDIRALDKAEYRSRFGTILQDACVFHQSALENVAMGRLATDAEFQLAAGIACAKTLLDAPTWADIGRLSGGEKQRLLMARALLQAPPILVFDEATSSIDVQTEAMFWDGLREIEESRIILFITHRPSFLSLANRVLFLEDHSVTVGTHSDLLAHNMAYRALIGSESAQGGY